MDNGHTVAWRDHMPFDDITRRALAWLAALAGIASLYAFFWWAASATGFFLFDGYRHTWRSLGTAIVFRDMDTVYYLLSWVFSVFGGFYGWIALVGFAATHRRGWDAVAPWIKTGCAVGVAAGLAFEPGRLLALLPMVCAVTLLLRSMLMPSADARRVEFSSRTPARPG
ncbi:hypothetical protein EJP67_26650 [Variovorax guangxiensis]|uniref:Uncharacterized protein n=1 Tax=Variovorax guangxiensis TaxID=1775474 RepID=A0A433MS73_9BURK|nr:hypothetical protein [Variovorax guangxiensis]RUR70644.1 hypothetical protein EJP67_26650 [Variovorax guangxiensis]